MSDLFLSVVLLVVLGLLYAANGKNSVNYSVTIYRPAFYSDSSDSGNSGLLKSPGDRFTIVATSALSYVNNLRLEDLMLHRENPTEISRFQLGQTIPCISDDYLTQKTGIM